VGINYYYSIGYYYYSCTLLSNTFSFILSNTLYIYNVDETVAAYSITCWITFIATLHASFYIGNYLNRIRDNYRVA